MVQYSTVYSFRVRVYGRVAGCPYRLGMALLCWIEALDRVSEGVRSWESTTASFRSSRNVEAERAYL